LSKREAIPQGNNNGLTMKVHAVYLRYQSFLRRDRQPSLAEQIAGFA